MTKLSKLLHMSPVIPVVTVPVGVDPIALAESLLAGGIPIIEITLRNDAGLAAIATISAKLPEMCVGAGTVWTTAQADQAIAAGSQFVVSPGISEQTHAACQAADVPLLPGAQTPSEVNHWQQRNYSLVKFFPAEAAGGIRTLKALGSVFPNMQFCPTGGITPQSAADYLALPSVSCVGGSWITPAGAMNNGDWQTIENLARQAVSLSQAPGINC
jgi:2-dehydro-3-deoxyphosphogluconate aldolase/(4S)-4-hydroxy-2-oxoglutarate aldolase